MKIVTKSFYDKDYYAEYFNMEIDGKHVFSAGGGEPEDNSIGRDLSFVYEISSLMELAAAAALNGEKIEVDHIECKTHEEFWGE